MYVAQKSWHKRFATNLCNSKKREKIISSLSYYHTNSAWYVSCDFHFSSLQTFGGQGQTAGDFFLPNIFRAFWGEGGWGGGTQSSAEASLCLREARERKNESGWGEVDGKGKNILPFPSCYRLPCAYYFLIIAIFYWDT